MAYDQFLQLVEALKWPIVVLIVFFVLRSTVAALLERMKRAGFGNKSIEFSEPAGQQASEQQRVQLPQSAPGALATSGDLPPPPATPALAAVERGIIDTLAGSNASDEIKRAWLVRGMAIARLERAHETTYRLIMGSQIALLLKANAGVAVSLQAAQTIFDEAKKTYPEIYGSFDFDNWLNWPINVGLIKRDAGASGVEVSITEVGKEFLHYLVGTGLTLPKAG